MNRAEVVTMHLAAKKAAEVTRQWLETEAVAEYDEQGTVPTWRGRDFTVSSAIKQGGPVVMDQAALLAWVKKAYPTEVETVERVRPAFLSGLVARAAKNGDGIGLPLDDDGTTVIGGMEWRTGGDFSHITIKPSADMRLRLDQFAAGIAAGEITFALPAVAE